MTSTTESTTAPIPRTALANKRILDRVQPKVDTSHVEAAGITRSVSFSSGEAKRLFLRCHQAFAVATNYVVSVGRKILPHADVDKLENELRGLIRQTKDELQNATLQAQHLFKEKHIERPARYRADPLVMEVDVISSLTREFIEVCQALDALMPLLETLEIEGVITSAQMEEQKARFKRRVMRISSAARMFDAATRKKVAEAKRKAQEEKLQNKRRNRRSVADDVLPPAAGDVLSTPVALVAAQKASDEHGEPIVEPIVESQPLVTAEG